jgi:AraC family transcriptional regulator
MVIEAVLRVNLAEQEDSCGIYPYDALLSSASTSWDGLYLQYHRQPPHEIVEHSCRQHRIIIHDRTLPSPMIEAVEELSQPSQVTPGTITVLPAGARNWAYWQAEHQFAVLAFEPLLFTQHLAHITDRENVQLIPTLSRPDSLIHSIGLALKLELESNGIDGRLYVDAMTAALMAHLVRHYSVHNPVLPTVSSGLSKRKLQQVVDYMNDYLDQDLTLPELAAVVHMSASYFSSSFKQSTGFSPHQYLIRCRIERAKQLLLQNELSIADVAHRLGFAHQSHLSRHFKRLVGVTPKAFLESQ